VVKLVATSDGGLASDRKDRLLAIQRETERRVRAAQEAQLTQQRTLKEAEELDEVAAAREQRLDALKLLRARARSAGLPANQAIPSSLELRNAEKHFAMHLLVRLGISPWKRFVEGCRKLQRRADEFRRKSLCYRLMQCLKVYVHACKHRALVEERRNTAIAVSHRWCTQLRRVFKEWGLLRRVVRAKADAVRRHFSRYTVLRRSLQLWRVALEAATRKRNDMLHRADLIAALGLRRRVFRLWLEGIDDLRIEREAHRRAGSTWTKAAAVLYS
jgi:hypothetical protein